MTHTPRDRWAHLPQKLCLLAVAVVLQATAFAQGAPNACGDLWNAYGPYDYRTDRDRLAIVERFHFTPQVEALISGKSGRIGGDLDYTLRAFPNHHRALLAMARYSEKLKTDKPDRANYTVDCYFDRAMRFAPDDSVVRVIFATHLAKTQREEFAVKQLEVASEVAKDNSFSQYNIGLVYLEMKRYDLALRQAHKAIELGFPGTELKTKLVEAGKWAEPQ